MVLDTSDDRYAAQKVLTAVSTRIEELPLLPRFGTSDPVFDELDTGGLYYTTATYFPEINITEVEQNIDGSGGTSISVAFDVLTEG